MDKQMIEVSSWVLAKRPSTYGCYSDNKATKCDNIKPSSQHGEFTQFVTRKATAVPNSPKQIWTAIATTLPLQNLNAPTQINNNSVATSVVSSLTLQHAQTIVIKIALADTQFTAGTKDPTPAAVQSSTAINPPQLVADSLAHWRKFWAKSAISLPTTPEIQRYWFGAQYIMGCIFRDDALAPSSGLYGPWVTTDIPGWYGDYTLDYNQEAQYYGVYGSNHPELAAPYFPPIEQWIPSAKLQAQQQAKYAKVVCPSKALHYACHLAPWGFQSRDDSIYMHWNGPFASMLFINDWEYTRNATFARDHTYPLLDGFNAWWNCFLNKTGNVYQDNNKYNPDENREGQRVPNPNMGLSFIKRTMAMQLEIAKALNITPPAYVSDILNNLVPFNVGKTTTNKTVWTDYPSAGVKHSDFWSMYPIWPSEYVTQNSSQSVLQTAKDSSILYSKFATGRPVELFPVAVRAGRDPEEIIAGFRAYLKNYQRTNMLPFTEGGGVENVGITRAVNEMLLQAPNGKYIDLFPVWPRNASASFTTLLAKGGFAVSATYSGSSQQVGSPFEVTAVYHTSRCVVKNPWQGGDVSVQCNHKDTPVRWSGRGWFSFVAPKGALCSVSHH
eukprot:TRINITY_DN20866_c0_g1_i1.p1 TRINITY_DN20866_c0_g1~~TRINITY_DN20866_c0_g1_i1.p1  ORF type:complete len:633 (-),score=75.86 TRINITY_DN20866_c0_g1_i1:93-1928(-)